MSAAHHHAGSGRRRLRARMSPPSRSDRLAPHRFPPLPVRAAHLVHDSRQEGTSTMLDRSQVDAVIYRVAVAAFTYYPDKPLGEAGYTVEEDLDWCMRPLRNLPAPDRDRLRDQVRELITNPGADRQGFIRHLQSLAADA